MNEPSSSETESETGSWYEYLYKVRYFFSTWRYFTLDQQDARLAWQARGPLLVLAQGVRVGRVKQRSECGEEPEAKKSG